MRYPNADKLKLKGVKVFKSNSGLDYKELVTLLQVDSEKSLFIVLDSDDQVSYPIGTIDEYLEYELEIY